MRGNNSGAPASALWIVGELDSQLRNKAPWINGGSAEMTVRPVSGGTAVTRKVDLTAASPVAEFDFADAGLGPGVYGVQLSSLRRTARRSAISCASPSPRSQRHWASRFCPGVHRRQDNVTRAPPIRFRKNELLRFELPTTSSDPVSARLLDSRGSALSFPSRPVSGRTHQGRSAGSSRSSRQHRWRPPTTRSK